MSTPQEQYLDAMNAAADNWAKAAQQFFTTTPQTSFPVSSVEPSEVIDQVFDFAEQFLSAQRQFAKSLATGASSVADTMRTQAETFQQNLSEAAERGIEATTKFVDTNASIAQDATETAKGNAEKVGQDVKAATETAAKKTEETAAAATTTPAKKAPAKKTATSTRTAAKKA